MLQGDEQPPVRRRTRNIDSNLRMSERSQEWQSSLLRARGQSGTSPQTDPVYTEDDIDIAYPSHPITSNSVVRRTSPQDVPQTQTRRIGNQTSAVTGMPRRQPGTKLPPAQRQPRTDTTPVRERFKLKGYPHWAFYVGLGMIAAIVLWLLGSSVVAWGQNVYNNWHYGYPRTFQTDTVVGHNNDSKAHPSHFIAMNLNRQIVVIEFPAGDPSKAVSYVAPIYISGNGGDLAPVTLEFRDVNGDGKPDMIIHVWLPGQNQVFVFINNGKSFVPSSGSDHINI
jgi:hypothetical protein